MWKEVAAAYLLAVFCICFVGGLLTMTTRSSSKLAREYAVARLVDIMDQVATLKLQMLRILENIGEASETGREVHRMFKKFDENMELVSTYADCHETFVWLGKTIMARFEKELSEDLDRYAEKDFLSGTMQMVL